MSASIFYQPVAGTCLDVGGGKSSWIEMMRRVVGHDLPTELDGRMTVRLAGAAAATTNEDHRRALHELIDAIEKHGTVRVWAEY